METDAALLEIFESNPARFQELTNLKLPPYAAARAEAMKKSVQVSCDVIFIPLNPADPHLVAELQMYFDHSIFHRAALARSLLWKKLNPRKECRNKSYQPRKVDAVIIFGNRAMLPPQASRIPGIKVLFLDELIKKLRKTRQDSPLIPVLAPLIESDQELEKHAEPYYAAIVNNPNLSSKEREVLGHVFIHFFSQRFQQISIQQIQKMIKHLTPIEKTLIGKQLIEIGREEGRQEGRQEGREEGREEGRQEGREEFAKNLIAEGEPDERIARLTGLSLTVIANLRKRLHSGAGD